MRTESELREQLTQHQTNLSLWRSGYLNPTEPDPELRRQTVVELAAAIGVLQWVLDIDPKLMSVEERRVATKRWRLDPAGYKRGKPTTNG